MKHNFYALHACTGVGIFVFLWIKIIIYFFLGHSEMQNNYFKLGSIFFSLIKTALFSRINFSHGIQSKSSWYTLCGYEYFLAHFALSLLPFYTAAHQHCFLVCKVGNFSDISPPLNFSFPFLVHSPEFMTNCNASLIQWCDFCSLRAGEEMWVAFSYLPWDPSTHGHQRSQSSCKLKWGQNVNKADISW